FGFISSLSLHLVSSLFGSRGIDSWTTSTLTSTVGGGGVSFVDDFVFDSLVFTFCLFSGFSATTGVGDKFFMKVISILSSLLDVESIFSATLFAVLFLAFGFSSLDLALSSLSFALALVVVVVDLSLELASNLA